jgi:quercetin dioxygenase-like cupin family protein
MDQEKSAADTSSLVSTTSDLIAYQNGSVVSRIISKTPGGSVTLFAFDEHQSLSEHTTPHEALIQVLEGEAEITIDGKPYHVGKDEMIILPADHPHAVMALSKFKMVLTMLRHNAGRSA